MSAQTETIQRAYLRSFGIDPDTVSLAHNERGYNTVTAFWGAPTKHITWPPGFDYDHFSELAGSSRRVPLPLEVGRAKQVELRRAALQLASSNGGDRVEQQVRYSSGRAVLNGEPSPTLRQIACVLHALADETHNRHMLDSAVRALGDGSQVAGLGRYFHALGDELEDRAIEQERGTAA